MGGARCAITTGSGLDTSALQYVESPSGTIGQSEVIAGTRGFDVTQRGPLTVNLVCDVNSGQANLRHVAFRDLRPELTCWARPA